MRNFHSLIFIGIIGGFLMSCSKKTTGNQEKLPKVKPAELFFALDSLSQTRPSSFYAKMSTKYKDSTRSQSFKTTIRSQSDSLMKASITFMRIPFVHALFSNEIVQISNRNDKCYVKQAVHEFSSKFGVELNLKTLEEILLGLPVGHEAGGKYFIERDPYNYTVSSHSKLQINSIRNKQKREIVVHYTLQNDLKSLKRVVINSFYDSSDVIINYEGRKEVDEVNFPEAVEVKIFSPKGEVELNWDYSKVRINGKEDFSFVIPETYERCP